ncbi:MAG: hypothetical protein PHW73_00545 [Atribacterota bacterium]|nr:hypothetical protein [Atribacterota bacterium]
MNRNMHISFRVSYEEHKAIMAKYGSSEGIRDHLLNADKNWYSDIFTRIGTAENTITSKLGESVQTILESLPKKRKPAKKEKQDKEDTPKVPVLVYPFSSDEFKKAWAEWIEYKWTEHKEKYKAVKTEQTAIDRVAKIANNDEKYAIELIKDAIGRQNRGIYLIKDSPANKPAITGKMVLLTVEHHFGKKVTKFFWDTLRASELHDKILVSEKSLDFHIEKLAKESGKDYATAVAILKRTLSDPIHEPKKNDQSLISGNSINKLPNSETAI